MRIKTPKVVKSVGKAVKSTVSKIGRALDPTKLLKINDRVKDIFDDIFKKQEAFFLEERRKSQPPYNQSPPWRLSLILNEICTRAQIPIKNLNTRQVDGDLAHGFSVTCNNSANDALQDLANIYLFDIASFDNALHFVKRGGAPVAVIEKTDLVADDQEPITTNRKDSLNIPYKINLEYQDIKGTNQANKQSNTRDISTLNQSEKSFTSKVIMDGAQAVQTVDKLHKIIVEEARGELNFKLPLNYIYLTVGDIIILDGQRVRLEKVELNNGYQSYTAIYDGDSNYQSDATNDNNNNVVIIEPPKILPPSGALILALDIPLLDATSDNLGVYFVAIASGDNFAGAKIALNDLHSSSSWTLKNACVTGGLTNPLNAHSIFYPDMHNKIIVELHSVTYKLQGATFADVLNGANLAYITDGKNGELIQFTTATQTGAKTWELGGLVRGLRGTKSITHNENAYFLMLDNAVFNDLEDELLNKNITFNSKVDGFDTIQTQTINFKGINQLERTPYFISYSKTSKYVDGATTYKLIVNFAGCAKFGSGKQSYMGKGFAGFKINFHDTEVITDSSTALIISEHGKGILTIEQLNTLNPNNEKIEVDII